MSAVTRPQVLHVRVASVERKQNVFVQITVKIHSKQVSNLKQINEFRSFGSGTMTMLGNVLQNVDYADLKIK